MKRQQMEKVEQIIISLVVAMVMSFSCMAILAALFAVDIFAQMTPAIAGVFLVLSALFYVILVLRDRLETVNS